MRMLLDTHILFWWMLQDGKLTVRHRELIEDDANEVCVSAVTGWEIAIKVKLGKWPEAAPLLPDLASRVMMAGLDLVPLTFAQAERAGSLDLVHRDPFDRMLAAQAMDLGIGILTSDADIARLGCRII